MENGRKSNTDEQKLVKGEVFASVRSWLGQEYSGIELQETPKIFVGRTYIRPSFYADKEGVVGEIFAHIGEIKNGQKNKISGDVLRMLFLEKAKGRSFRKILVVCDAEVEEKLNGISLMAEYIRTFEIEIKRILISEQLRERLICAQDRQRMVNA